MPPWPPANSAASAAVLALQLAQAQVVPLLAPLVAPVLLVLLAPLRNGKLPPRQGDLTPQCSPGVALLLPLPMRMPPVVAKRSSASEHHRNLHNGSQPSPAQ